MAKEVTLKDIAERLNTSTVTVSKALTGQKGVSEQLRSRIVELARELGYQPPRSRKNQEHRKSYNIGVLVSEIFLGKYSSFYARMYQQVASEAMDSDSFTMLESISIEMEQNLEMPRLIRDKKADGIIVIGRLSDSYLSLLRKTDKPTIYLDFMDERRGTDAVITDNFYGTYYLTNYLIGRGHRDIAFVGTISATGSIMDRFLGYQKAMLEHSLTVKEEYVIGDRDKVTGDMDMNKYFKLPRQLPTAFVCNCDLTASVLVEKLDKQGIRVPRDVSVVGFDNFLHPGVCYVGITSYEVDMTQMARRAVHNLIHKLEHEFYHKGITVVEGRLIEKESVRDYLA